MAKVQPSHFELSDCRLYLQFILDVDKIEYNQRYMHKPARMLSVFANWANLLNTKLKSLGVYTLHKGVTQSAIKFVA